MMKQPKKPAPSKDFIERQRELQRLLDLRGETRTAALSLEEELEGYFVSAWGFSPDIGGHAREMKMMAGRACDGFDHCTFYYDPATKAQVVVTQPYVDAEEVVEEMTRGLTLGNWATPEIIAAPEWAFYYPGRATLVIVKFPRGYKSILSALDRLWSPAAKASLRCN